MYTHYRYVPTRLTCSRICGNILAASKRIGPRSDSAKKAVKMGIESSKIRNPDLWKQIYKRHSERMKQNNPSTSREILDKVRQTKMERGILHSWFGKRGGNGFLSQPQMLLAMALGWNPEEPTKWGEHPLYGRWKPEVPIKTGNSTSDSSGYPPVYKSDIGCPDLKLSIEVDGGGHALKMNVEKDLKKDQKLMELGWTTLRFTNEEIMNNLSVVLLEIQNVIKTL